MNAPRKELEANFVRDLKAYKLKHSPADCNVDVARLNIVKDGTDTLYTLPGKHYGLETITNTTFFKLKDSVDYIPVVDAKFPVQTVANTLLLDCDAIPAAKISLTVIGSDKKNNSCSASQTVGCFARSMGCVPYLAMKKLRTVSCKVACSYIIRNLAMTMC